MARANALGRNEKSNEFNADSRTYLMLDAGKFMESDGISRPKANARPTHKARMTSGYSLSFPVCKARSHCSNKSTRGQIIQIAMAIAAAIWEALDLIRQSVLSWLSGGQ